MVASQRIAALDCPSMWSILNGTIVNVVAVLFGSGAGLAAGARVPQRYQRIILDVLGLVTITLGIDAAVIVMGDLIGKYGDGVKTYGARLAMVMVASLVVGAILGTWLKLQERLEGLGAAIHRRFAGGGHGDNGHGDNGPGDDGPATTAEPTGAKLGGGRMSEGARFAEGFLTASVIFCVGPLTLLGCLQNGADADPSLLYIKSCLDLFCSMALASALGVGVVASVLTIIVFQGGLSLAAGVVGRHIPELSLQMMNVVGGVVLLATALSLLEIRKIPVANLLPAIFLPPLVIALVEALAPGMLITKP